MAFEKVTHVIFDLDGLLLDTETIYTEATNRIIKEYGKVYTWSEKALLMGLTGQESAKKIVEMFDLPISWEQYYETAQKLYQKLMPEAKPMPDTEGIYQQVLKEIAQKFGKNYTRDLQYKVLGTVEKDTARICITEMDLPISLEDFLDLYHIKCNDVLTSCPFMTGAERLVNHLHKNGIPIAVATSSTQPSMELKTQKYKPFFQQFNHIVCGGTDPDVKQGKPHPDIFLVAANRFPDKPKPEQCLVLEDAPNGVTAARKANMQCVMVPDPHLDKSLTTHATVVLGSLEDFNPEQFGLPAFNGV